MSPAIAAITVMGSCSIARSVQRLGLRGILFEVYTKIIIGNIFFPWQETNLVPKLRYGGHTTAELIGNGKFFL
jgi:hypothetical protein